jgi:translocation protein SEC63
MKTFYLQETVIQGFPLINLSVEAYTEGEKEVVAGDIITIKIKITQLNVPEGKHMGYVYSNRYPFLKKPQWYLLATDDTMTNIVAVEKIYLEDRVFVKEIRDRTQKPGTIQITVSVLNDSYRGFDQFVKVRCTVLEHAERQVITYDQEDLDAKKEPSVMAQMMDQGDDSSSEEEEEQDEKAELQKKLAKAGIQPTSAGKKKQVEAAETTDEKTESTSETKKD